MPYSASRRCSHPTVRPDDQILALQLGRSPRGRWRVVSRCSWGSPRAIAVAPVLEDGELFPTTFWLVCPHLVAAVHASESSGESAAWSRRLAMDTELASEALAADSAYRAARRSEGGGVDPCPNVGIAGQTDPLIVKCLHARLAASLAGVLDPVGERFLEQLANHPGLECENDDCGRLGVASD